MGVFDIDLPDGSVRVDSFRVRTTYGGLLEGLPCRKINEHMIEGTLSTLQSRYEHEWSPKVSMVEPEITAQDGEFMRSPRESLPPLVWEVHLSRLTPVNDPSEWGSHAVVLCFTDQMTDERGPRQLLQKVLGSLVWTERASDYSP